MESLMEHQITFYLQWIRKRKILMKYYLLQRDFSYAESNPTSDLNGDDVSSKLKILSSLCFNSFLNNNIYVEGIKGIEKVDINNANKLGYKIKLLGLLN